jgi:serine/threonine protein kinase
MTQLFGRIGSVMSLQDTLSQGTMIGGHYIVDSLLNSGGFGAVYRGIDTSEGKRACAIKETYDVTPAARRQALMEASVLLTVRSQHLPEVYDAFEFNGRFYLVMELIEGQNLLQLLTSRIAGAVVGEAELGQQSSGPCTEKEVLDWLLPIMDVLQDLHSRNPPILHRDIKPGNLILTPQQRVVLVDFGLTKLYDPTRNTHAMIKAVTAGFSPLEQYLGQTSPQSDIYSMAATMYLLLTNRLPSAAISRSMDDDLIAPRLLNPFISPKVEQVLLKALTVHANQRYQSMAEFAQALRTPAFTAYAEPTVELATPSVQDTQATSTTLANQPTPPLQSSYTPVPALNTSQPIPPSYAAVQSVPVPPPKQSKLWKRKGSQPEQQKVQPPSSYPVLPPAASVSGYGMPSYPAFPPAASVSGYGTPSQAQKMNYPQRVQSAQRLPSPSNLGCLWGILQGIVAALIVWFLKQEGDFFLALLVGLIGYLAAGFFATRRGGNFFRGASAGYWAGVTSLLLFGTTLGIFLVIAFSQQLHQLTISSNFSNQAARDAWSAVQPQWPNLVILPDQPFLNFVAVLVALVFTAWLLGLIGGVMGSLQHAADAVNRQRQLPHA